mmetsp:Transcript_4504/g.11729  ORF Transcript_4504/g.11729 Transcript_4504/m.11729 type:complete len:364 (-) Transcript_4504:81-1172(-)
MDEFMKLFSENSIKESGMEADGGRGKNARGGGAAKMNENMKGHAERLWKFLDHLAEEDPEAYQKFLKEQAEAAGEMDFAKPSGGARSTRMPSAFPGNPVREDAHPVFVIVTRDAATDAGRKVAVFAWEGKSLAKDALPQVKGKPRQERHPRGLPPSDSSYLVLDTFSSSEAINSALGAPAELAELVQRIFALAESSLGFKLDRKSKKVLVLKERIGQRKACKEAAVGTSAAQLSEATISELANLASPSATKANKAGNKGGNKAQKPLIEVISSTKEEEAEQKLECCVASYKVASEGSDSLKIEASLSQGVSVQSMDIRLSERTLTFSCAGHKSCIVGLPYAPKNQMCKAKFSSKTGTLSVRLK